MGFYVNLEMPKNCPMCPFAHYDDMFNTFRGCDITRGKRWAVKNDKDYAKLSTRPDWCPLTEVPEPHGRLIDADVFLAEERHLYCENCARRKGMKNGKMKFVYGIGDAPCRSCGIMDVLDDIDDAPTIIPAEEAE